MPVEKILPIVLKAFPAKLLSACVWADLGGDLRDSPRDFTKLPPFFSLVFDQSTLLHSYFTIHTYSVYFTNTFKISFYTLGLLHSPPLALKIYI